MLRCKSLLAFQKKSIVALIVVVMNAVFWGMKPRKKATSEAKRT